MKKEEILSICIEDIRSGKSTIAECLERYPNLSRELKPLLEIAAALKPDEVTPSPEFAQSAKRRILADEHPAPGKTTIGRWFWSKPAVVRFLVTFATGLVLLGAGGAGTVYAAQGSLPGDTLYPVKIGVENLQLAVTAGPAAKADLHLKFAQQRIDEATRQAEMNRNVSASALETVKQQFDSAIRELSTSPDTAATSDTLSQLSLATLDQQLELNQALSKSPGSSQALEQAIAEARRENTIAQVAYSNRDFLKQQPSVADQQLDVGQFKIEGTLQSVQGSTWNVGGTVIQNVHSPGKTPAVGSSVNLEGLVQDNQVFLSQVETSDTPGQPTMVEGQFAGTNKNGTANIGGISVNIDNGNGSQLQPGDNVQLQSGHGNGGLRVTARESPQANGNSASLSGVLTAVDNSSHTVTVKIAGNEISVNLSEAQIAGKSKGGQTFSLSDLNHLTGKDIKINGLHKQNGVIYGQQVQVSGDN